MRIKVLILLFISFNFKLPSCCSFKRLILSQCRFHFISRSSRVIVCTHLSVHTMMHVCIHSCSQRLVVILTAALVCISPSKIQWFSAASLAVLGTWINWECVHGPPINNYPKMTTNYFIWKKKKNAGCGSSHL